MEELKVLELFSGIGGYHSALQIIDGKLSRHKLKVIGAVDINTVSNEVAFLLFILFFSQKFLLQVYKHIHPNTPCLQRNITGLTLEYLRYLVSHHLNDYQF